MLWIIFMQVIAMCLDEMSIIYNCPWAVLNSTNAPNNTLIWFSYIAVGCIFSLLLDSLDERATVY